MKKILIVEDSLPIVTLHKNIAKKAGLEPVVAMTLSDVKEFEDQMDDFFCAVIDYSLPDAPNGEAIKFIVDRNVPSIVMTGLLDDDIRNHILQMPIVDYITKESRQAYHYLLSLIKKLLTNHLTKTLVVDDSLSSRKYISQLLKRHNYTVLEAPSGAAALDLLYQHEDIKLVITDKEMPNMEGFELCSEIRARYTKEEIAIIGISSTGSQSLTAKFIKNGANDFLSKPVCHEEFYCRVIQNIDYIKSIETIKHQANTDYLTGLSNRRHFFDSVEPLISNDQPQSLAMMDIDKFKSINDTYGHDVGDIVLKHIAALLEAHFSQDFIIARLGGEEFAVFFGELSGQSAFGRLEQFRIELANSQIDIGSGKSLTCTISIGLASRSAKNTDELLVVADQFLYDAKASGRNQVIAGS